MLVMFREVNIQDAATSRLKLKLSAPPCTALSNEAKETRHEAEAEALARRQIPNV